MIVIPGYTFAAARDPITPAKANLLGRPAVTLEDGEVTLAKLDPVTQGKINDTYNGRRGRNLLCNGNFKLWETDTYTGVVPSSYNHEYGSAVRWVVPNDAARNIARYAFAYGTLELPDSPTDYLAWGQTAPLTVNPGYLAQRLEDVRVLSGRTVTFSIYARSSNPLTVVPTLRQWFGNLAAPSSAQVLVPGTPVDLTPTWQKIVQTFNVPNVAGKTVPNVVRSFTEFRITVPQGLSFLIHFAQAQVELGNIATPIEQRLAQDDFVYADRYRQGITVNLSNNITVWKPSWFLARKLYTPTLALYPASGAGATVGQISTSSEFVYQTANHSVITNAGLLADCELRDA